MLKTKLAIAPRVLPAGLLFGALLLSPAAFAQDWESDSDMELGAPAESDPAESSASEGSSGKPSGIGVGIHGMLSGVTGPAGVYNTDAFHIEGIVGFLTNGSTVIDIGGRFWYHLHRAEAADLSLGGGLGIEILDQDVGMGNSESATIIGIEVGAQIRFFVVSNVALSADLGLAIQAGDGEGVGLIGDLTAGFGLTYFL